MHILGSRCVALWMCKLKNNNKNIHHHANSGTEINWIENMNKQNLIGICVWLEIEIQCHSRIRYELSCIHYNCIHHIITCICSEYDEYNFEWCMSSQHSIFNWNVYGCRRQWAFCQITHHFNSANTNGRAKYHIHLHAISIVFLLFAG